MDEQQERQREPRAKPAVRVVLGVLLFQVLGAGILPFLGGGFRLGIGGYALVAGQIGNSLSNDHPEGFSTVDSLVILRSGERVYAWGIFRRRPGEP